MKFAVPKQQGWINGTASLSHSRLVAMAGKGRMAGKEGAKGKIQDYYVEIAVCFVGMSLYASASCVEAVHSEDGGMFVII